MTTTDYVRLVDDLLEHPSLVDPLRDAFRQLPIPVLPLRDDTQDPTSAAGEIEHLPAGCQDIRHQPQVGMGIQEVPLYELLETRTVCEKCLIKVLRYQSFMYDANFGHHLSMLPSWLLAVRELEAALQLADAGELTFATVPWQCLRLLLPQRTSSAEHRAALDRLDRELEQRAGRLASWIRSKQPHWLYVHQHQHLTEIDVAVRNFVRGQSRGLPESDDHVAVLDGLLKGTAAQMGKGRHPVLIKTGDGTGMRSLIELLETVSAGPGWRLLSVESGHVAHMTQGSTRHAAFSAVAGWEQDSQLLERLHTTATLWLDGTHPYEAFALAGRLAA